MNEVQSLVCNTKMGVATAYLRFNFLECLFDVFDAQFAVQFQISGWMSYFIF